jgi:hypothetical protein
MKKKIKWKKELVSVMWRWSAPGEFSLSNLWRIFTDTLSCLDAENLRQMNITFAVQNYCKNTQQDVCCARRCDG